MGQRYTASFSGVAATAAQDLFEILAPTDAAVKLISARVGQSSDEGDAQAEMLPIEIVRGEGTVTSGSGGTSPTVEKLQKGLPAAGSTVEANNTVRMVVGTGSLHTILREAFNVQVGWLYQPVPSEEIIVSPGDRIIIALPSAPADALTLEGSVTFEEIGG